MTPHTSTSKSAKSRTYSIRNATHFPPHRLVSSHHISHQHTRHMRNYWTRRGGVICLNLDFWPIDLFMFWTWTSRSWNVSPKKCSPSQQGEFLCALAERVQTLEKVSQTLYLPVTELPTKVHALSWCRLDCRPNQLLSFIRDRLQIWKTPGMTPSLISKSTTMRWTF
jgi:hypothetical protein